MGKIAIIETAFDDWFAKAKQGDAIEYVRGYLPRDRKTISVDREARAAWFAYRDQKVLLTQRRHGEWDYSYIAVRGR